MQLQFRNFPELLVYTVTVPFSRWIILIYRSSVYRHPPALPPAPLSSLVPLCATLRHSCYHFSNLLRAHRSLQARQPPILGKNRGSGSKIPSKTRIFMCRANKTPGKNSTCAERTKSLEKKTALLGAERTTSLEKQHFGCRANQILGVAVSFS